MAAINHEQDLWRQWRDWTAREEQSILAENWEKLARCQEAKQRLQSAIAECSGALAGREDSVRAMGRELIEHERRNQALLNATRQRLQSQHDDLEAGLRNLRRVRGSYAATRQGCWHSYS